MENSSQGGKSNFSVVVMETLVLTETALLTHKFCFNWIIFGSFLPFSFAVDTLPLTALDLGGNMGQWGPRDKRQSLACGSFSRVEIANELLSQLKTEKILCTFHTAFRL